MFDIAERQGIYAGSERFALVRAKAEEAVADVDSLAGTYPHIDAVLDAAGGKHSTLLVPGLVDQERGAGLLPTVDSDGHVVTVTLPTTDATWDGQEYVDAVAPALVGAFRSGACGAIVDLRGNTGGDTCPLLAAVSLLYDAPVTITGNSVRGGGTPMAAPVAVLTDSMTASSGEATMLAFRGLENFRSFGIPTAGYATANIMFEMPDGARIQLTTAHNKARTGEVFGENPIEQDEFAVSAGRLLRK